MTRCQAKLVNCPINGDWTIWTSWSSCSATCDGGEKTRYRTCTNPAPQFGGNDCQGDLGETVACNTNPCPIKGGFSLWSSWSECSVTCGRGIKTRVRKCDNPVPQFGGRFCIGKAQQRFRCNAGKCFTKKRRITYSVGGWSDWSECSATCGKPEDVTKSRTRACLNNKRQMAIPSKCKKPTVEVINCKHIPECRTVIDTKFGKVIGSLNGHELGPLDVSMNVTEDMSEMRSFTAVIEGMDRDLENEAQILASMMTGLFWNFAREEDDRAMNGMSSTDSNFDTVTTSTFSTGEVAVITQNVRAI